MHDEGNYIASVPLVLIQCDGICAEEMGTYLFTEHDRRTAKVDDALSKVPDTQRVFGALLSAPSWDVQVGASISRAKVAQKANGPNRNGIVHGSRKHLDYGSRINSYKATSLLFFLTRLFDPDLGFGKLLGRKGSKPVA